MIESKEQEAYTHKLEFVEAMAQLDAKEKEIKVSQGYGKAYLWSVIIPPIGIYYFIKYLFFMGGGKENIKAGIISLLLTLLSLFLSIIIMASFFKQTTSSISSQDIQMLKDMALPSNQKDVLELYK